MASRRSGHRVPGGRFDSVLLHDRRRVADARLIASVRRPHPTIVATSSRVPAGHDDDERAATAPDQEVRVHITPAAATRLTDELGTYSTELDGTLSSRGADSLAVTVPIARRYNGVTLDSATQVLLVGKSEVIDVHRRELSRVRTVLTGVGALVGFAALAHAVVQITDPNPGSDEPLPPPPPPGPRRVSGHHIGVRIPFP